MALFGIRHTAFSIPFCYLWRLTHHILLWHCLNHYRHMYVCVCEWMVWWQLSIHFQFTFSTFEHFNLNTFDFSIMLNRIEFQTVFIMANGNSWSLIRCLMTHKYFRFLHSIQKCFYIKYRFTNQKCPNFGMKLENWMNNNNENKNKKWMRRIRSNDGNENKTISKGNGHMWQVTREMLALCMHMHHKGTRSRFHYLTHILEAWVLCETNGNAYRVSIIEASVSSSESSFALKR